MKDLKNILIGMAWGLLLCVAYSLLFPNGCTGRASGGDTIDVRVDSVRDTAFIEKHDTVPAEKVRKVLKYITVPACGIVDSLDEDSTQYAEATLPVVQKTFSDDSTYTAYVSGLEHEIWPKLDSIIVRQREVRNTITKTITINRRSHWHIGVQAGYGYGFKYKGLEPYIGVGLTYTP